MIAITHNFLNVFDAVTKFLKKQYKKNPSTIKCPKIKSRRFFDRRKNIFNIENWNMYEKYVTAHRNQLNVFILE